MSYRRIVLLGVDAMGMDLLSEHTAPNLFQIQQEGLHCTRARSHGNPTQFSYPSIMTSTLPLDFGGYDVGIRNRPRALAEVFQAANFHTVGISTTAWLSSLFGYVRGYDQFFAMHNPVASWDGVTALYLQYWIRLVAERRIPGIVCYAQLEQLLRSWLPYVLAHSEGNARQAGETPVHDYAYHGWESHMHGVAQGLREISAQFESDPSQFISQNMSLLGQGDLRVLLGLEPTSGEDSYIDATDTMNQIIGLLCERNEEPIFIWATFRDVHDGRWLPRKVHGCPLEDPNERAVFYWDQQFGKFLEHLQEEKLMEDTLLVVFADHSVANPGSLSEQSLRVPMIFWAQDQQPQLITKPCGLIDLAPTVLDFAGLRPERSFQGLSIRSNQLSSERILISEHAGRGPCDLERKRIQLAVTQGCQKAILFEGEDRTEFYAITDDFNDSPISHSDTADLTRLEDHGLHRISQVRNSIKI